MLINLNNNPDFPIIDTEIEELFTNEDDMLIHQKEAEHEERICSICDGGPANHCGCSCGYKKWSNG